MKSANLKNVLVQSFCSEITSCTPITIPCVPLMGELVKASISVVDKQVAKHGGSLVCGWAIWEWPGVLIEAEFVTVWQPKGKQMIDITPKRIPTRHTIFIPTPEVTYTGQPINNIRKPLIDHALVREYIQASDKIFEQLNKPHLTDDQDKTTISELMTKHRHAMERLQLLLVERLGRG